MTSVMVLGLVACVVLLFGFALSNILRLPHLLSLEQQYRSTPVCATGGDLATELNSAAAGSCRARVAPAVAEVSLGGDLAPDTLTFILADGPRIQADVARGTNGWSRGQQVTLELYRGDVRALQTSFGWIMSGSDPDSQVQDAWTFPFLILAGVVTLLPKLVLIRGLISLIVRGPG
ncbi:MAG TPA: hypothetical protein VKF59_15485 [Candidatus Dormibacteraeota bacterium]|nr:hypothetical protein [Candidatus Dormibacteraeota bacterium]